MKLDNLNAFVFGSAVNDPEGANDIDIAVTFEVDRPIFKEQRAAARSAVAERLIRQRPAGLTTRMVQLDVHFVDTVEIPGGPHISLPLPFGRGSKKIIPLIETGVEQRWRLTERDELTAVVVEHYELIEPPNKVPLQIKWEATYTIPAAIRAAETPEELDRFLRQVRGLEPLDGEAKVRGGQFYNAHIDLGEYPWDTRSEWDHYVAGLTALQSAIGKCAFWEDSELRTVPMIRFLDRLSARGPSGTALQEASDHSPGGRARLFCGQDRVYTEYGRSIWTYEQALSQLCSE